MDDLRQTLTLIIRRDCELCEIFQAELARSVANDYAVELLDVDSEDDLRRQYGEFVPTLLFDGQVVCFYRFDPAALERTIHGSSKPA